MPKVGYLGNWKNRDIPRVFKIFYVLENVQSVEIRLWVTHTQSVNEGLMHSAFGWSAWEKLRPVCSDRKKETKFHQRLDEGVNWCVCLVHFRSRPLVTVETLGWARGRLPGDNDKVKTHLSQLFPNTFPPLRLQFGCKSVIGRKGPPVASMQMTKKMTVRLIYSDTWKNSAGPSETTACLITNSYRMPGPISPRYFSRFFFFFSRKER